MNRALWITRKNYLCCLIKEISDGHGGDDLKFLRFHCKEVIANHPDEKIEEAIKCYEELKIQLKYQSERSQK